jgi:cardiolipin synthase
MKVSVLQRWRHRRRVKRPAHPPPPAGHHRFRWWWIAVCVILLVALFFRYTTAKIVREPMVLNQGPADPIFIDSFGPLLGAEFTRGNKVELLANGDAFFPVMLDAISRAQHSITLETYIWSSGTISDKFIAALSDRARHGVKVHVLVDGMGALKFDDSDQRRLLNAGVEFIYYAREHWWQVKPNINQRTHRKLLIIDGHIGFTGGMCVDDHWLGNADSPNVWRETQLEVEGPVVRQMQSVFATNWVQTTGRLLIGRDYFPADPPARDGALAMCYKSGPNEDPENARISYLMAIAAARKSIRISHAYFVPDDLAINMLLAARARGVRVEVIVPAINDSRFGRAASRSRWDKLLAAGVEFHAYLPAMYHAKVMIVDDVFLTIGSVNFDNRSFGINDEVNVNVVDHGVAAAGLRLFESDLRASRPLTWEEFRSRPWWQKQIDWFCGLFRSQL